MIFSRCRKDNDHGKPTVIHNTVALLKSNLAVVRDVSLLSGLRVVQLLASLASTYVLVRAISQEQFGYYQFVLAAASSLAIFSLPEMNNAVMQSLTRGFYGTYRRALRTVLVCCLGATFVLMAIAAWYFTQQLPRLGFGLLMAAVLFPFGTGLILWKGRCAAEGRFADLARLDGLNSILTSLAVIAVVTFVPGNFLAALFVFFLAPALRNFVMTLSDLRSIPSSADVEAGSIKYGTQTSVYSGLSLLAERLDNVILFVFLSPTTVALFASADRVAELFRSITRDIAGALAPRLVRKPRYTERLDHAFRLYAVAMGGALIVFAFAILPSVFRLIFTPEYDGAVPYAQALICSVAVGNLAAMRFRFIRSRMDAVSYRDVMLASAIAKLGSLVILVPIFGLAGAVASVFVHRLTLLAAVHFAMRKFYSPETA